MKTLHFENGDQMPTLGLGTWKFSPGGIYTAVKEALRLGYRHIDCAAAYENEAEIGQALGESLKEGMISRDQLWITSKLRNNAHMPEDVQPALEKTLSDLQVDFLDLFLMHWPVALKKGIIYPESAGDFVDPNKLTISTTWLAMEAMVTKGLCKHLGVSNFSVNKIRALVDTANRKPEVNQIELHPFLQQPAMLDYCSHNGILLTAYAPLGASNRPSHMKAKGEPILLDDPVILQIAKRRDATPAQVLISWSIHRQTAVLVKSENTGRLKQNLGAIDISLNKDDMKKISELDRHYRYYSGALWVLKDGPYTIANIWDE